MENGSKENYKADAGSRRLDSHVQCYRTVQLTKKENNVLFGQETQYAFLFYNLNLASNSQFVEFDQFSD